MCRNIRILFNFEPPATPDEIHAAALQYVRKVSGTRKPSRDNEPAFEDAVREITDATARLIEALVPHSPPRDRTTEAAKARERWTKREQRIRG